MQLFMVMLILTAVVAMVAVYYTYFMKPAKPAETPKPTAGTPKPADSLKKVSFYGNGFLDEDTSKYKPVYVSQKDAIFGSVTGLNKPGVLNNQDKTVLTNLANSVSIYLKSQNKPLPQYNFITIFLNGYFKLYNLPEGTTPNLQNKMVPFAVDGYVSAATFSYKP